MAWKNQGMTDRAPEMEEAPVEGREKAKAGATFFTLTIWLVIGGVAGVFIAAATKELSPPGESTPIGFFLLIPLAVGVLQRTTTDKEITWYKREAQIIGLIVGALAAYANF